MQEGLPLCLTPSSEMSSLQEIILIWKGCGFRLNHSAHGRQKVWETRAPWGDWTGSWKCRVGEKLGLAYYILKVFISFISPFSHNISRQSSRTDSVYYNSVSDIYLPNSIWTYIISFRFYNSLGRETFVTSSSQILGLKN